MAIIEIEKLSKSYRVYQKKEGLIASVTGLFRREYRDVHAVRGIAKPCPEPDLRGIQSGRKHLVRPVFQRGQQVRGVAAALRDFEAGLAP